MAAKFKLLLVILICVSPLSAAQQNNALSYLQQYFAGAAIQFGYGSGISSNSPRVELTVHYCASGYYYSAGRSCRPNIVAKGYQCTQLQDAGQWRIVSESGNHFIQWQSQSSGPGYLQIFIRNNGMVVDGQGNPFVKVGRANCS